MFVHHALDLYTIGNGETIATVYKNLSMLLGTDFITYVKRTVAVWGLLFAILASVFQGRFHTWIYHFLASFLIYWIFFLPTLNLNIIDTEVSDKPYLVSQVPFGVGFIASMASTFSYEMTKKIDEVFQNVPGPIIEWSLDTGSHVVSYNTKGIGYLHTGYAGIFDYLKMGLEIDPKLVENKFNAVYEMDSYIQQCFIPYAASMDQTQLNNLLKSDHLLKAIKVQSAFLMTYNGQTWSCNEFYDKVKKDWKKFVKSVSTTRNGEYALGLANYMLQHIVDSVNAMSDANLSFSRIVTQSGIINLIKDDYFAGLPSDMNNRLLASYIVGRAEAKTKLWGEAMFLWASKVVPTLQAFLEDFFVILFPFLIILIFLPLVSFGGVRAAVGYLKVIAWVYLITPVLAIIDALIKLTAIEKTTLWLQSVNLHGITLGDYGYLLSQADFYPAVAGAAAMSAPLWAWMLLQGFETGVMGMAELVGSIGTQFINQGVTPSVLTSNIARDSRELQAGIMSGQTPIAALSNAGTWMFEQNANLPGMYEGVAGYEAFSQIENQIGVEGALQATMAGTLYQTLMKDGPGVSWYKVTHGDVKGALETGALNRNEITLPTDFGLVKFTYGINGNLEAAEIEAGMNSNIISANLQLGISQARSFAINELASLVWGNTKSYQKAFQTMTTLTAQFLEAFERDQGKKTMASITQNSQVKQALSDAIDLANVVGDELGLSNEKRMEFVSALGAEIKAAGGNVGGNLLLSLALKALNAVVPEVGAKGAHVFDNKRVWDSLTRFTSDRAYDYVQETAVSYALKNEAFFGEVKKEAGSILHGVTLQDLKQMSETWQKMESYAYNLNESFNQVETQSGTLTVNSLPGFLNWMSDGDKVKEAELMVAMAEAAYHNNTAFFQKFGQAYAAYTMEKTGMKDASQQIHGFIESAKTSLMGAVDAEVGNGVKEVLTSFQNQYQNLATNYWDPYKVDPNQNVDITPIFSQVNAENNIISNNITKGETDIILDIPHMPQKAAEVLQYTKHDPSLPLNFEKNFWTFVLENPSLLANYIFNQLTGLPPIIGMKNKPTDEAQNGRPSEGPNEGYDARPVDDGPDSGGGAGGSGTSALPGADKPALPEANKPALPDSITDFKDTEIGRELQIFAGETGEVVDKDLLPGLGTLGGIIGGIVTGVLYPNMTAGTNLDQLKPPKNDE